MTSLCIVRLTPVTRPSVYRCIALDLCTLPEDLKEFEPQGWRQRVHDNGWTIKGFLSSDYFTWCATWKAIHPTHGTVEINDDDNDAVRCSSEVAYEAFLEVFPDWEEFFDIEDI